MCPYVGNALASCRDYRALVGYFYRVLPFFVNAAQLQNGTEATDVSVGEHLVS